jgi:UDP-N-acetylglucosamine--N-acetylmuramyl-(pentapeptide) pyrophosphoryl-undecaprenol N-acetylglucosamine transferase
MMGRTAASICTVFEKTDQYFPADKVVRTGMPVRSELAPTEPPADSQGFTTLALGGSQGARAVNQAVVEIAGAAGDEWQHVAGPKLYDEVRSSLPSMPDGYKLESFLDAGGMKRALESADLAIARSGSGTIAEFALYGLPAIYIPLPTSFANHQLHNAREIEAIGGGQVVEQSRIADLGRVWKEWRDDASRRERAATALRNWAVPDAAQRVLQVVKEAAG